MPTEPSSSVAAIWAILRKECRSEWRTRYGISAALLFAITTLTTVSFAVGRMPDRTDVLAALFWIVLLFAAGVWIVFQPMQMRGTLPLTLPGAG